MSSPFSKYMEGKNPLKNVEKPAKPVQKPEPKPMSDGAPQMSPLEQGGYRGGGDINSYYVPMAGVYQNLQDSISKNMAEAYKYKDYKNDPKENLLTHEEAKKMYSK